MVRIREIEKSDLKIINSWRNESKLIENLGAPFRYINYQVDENWFCSYMNNRSRQLDV